MEMHREPEVPEAKVPVVECHDGPARITSKELAPIHSVKKGTLQNACSTRPTVVADLVKSALMRTARLKNSLAKGPKRMVNKSAVAVLKKNERHQRTRETRCIRSLIKYTTIGLRIPGYGAAEVFIDFTEELRHTETDPTCKIHKSCCTSR